MGPPRDDSQKIMTEIVPRWKKVTFNEQNIFANWSFLTEANFVLRVGVPTQWKTFDSN
jgi:hypothetical protein